MFIPDDGVARPVYTSTDIGTGGYIIKTTKISDTQLQVAPGQGGYFFIVAGADVPMASSPALQDVVTFRSATPWAANWGETGIMQDPAGKVTSSTGTDFNIDNALTIMSANIPTFSDGSKSAVYSGAINVVSQKAYKVATRIRLNDGDIINTIGAIAPTAPSERWGNFNFRGLAIASVTLNGNALGYNNASTIEVLGNTTTSTTVSQTHTGSLGVTGIVTTNLNAVPGRVYAGTITTYRNGEVFASNTFNWVAPSTPTQNSFTADNNIAFTYLEGENPAVAAPNQLGGFTATVDWTIDGIAQSQLFGSANLYTNGATYGNVVTNISFELPE